MINSDPHNMVLQDHSSSKGQETTTREQTDPYSSRLTSRFIAHLNVFVGVIGAIFIVLVFTLDGLFRPGYSPISQPISDLGVGPSAWILNFALIIAGVSFITFAVGFTQLMHVAISKGWLIAITILLVLTGIGTINDGIFTKQAIVLHALGFAVLFYALSIAQFVIGWKIRKASLWYRYNHYSMITGLITFLLICISLLHYILPSVQFIQQLNLQIGGIFERFLAIEALVWYVFTGYVCVANGRS